MRVQQPVVTFDPPVIDAVEARWAAEAVASLVRQLDPDSMVGLCLEQARHELLSLAASAGCGPTHEVIGPVRLRVA